MSYLRRGSFGLAVVLCWFASNMLSSTGYAHKGGGAQGQEQTGRWGLPADDTDHEALRHFAAGWTRVDERTEALLARYSGDKQAWIRYRIEKIRQICAQKIVDHPSNACQKQGFSLPSYETPAALVRNTASTVVKAARSALSWILEKTNISGSTGQSLLEDLNAYLLLIRDDFSLTPCESACLAMCSGKIWLSFTGLPAPHTFMAQPSTLLAHPYGVCVEFATLASHWGTQLGVDSRPATSGLETLGRTPDVGSQSGSEDGLAVAAFVVGHHFVRFKLEDGRYYYGEPLSGLEKQSGDICSFYDGDLLKRTVTERNANDAGMGKVVRDYHRELKAKIKTDGLYFLDFHWETDHATRVRGIGLYLADAVLNHQPAYVVAVAPDISRIAIYYYPGPEDARRVSDANVQVQKVLLLLTDTLRLRLVEVSSQGGGDSLGLSLGDEFRTVFDVISRLPMANRSKGGKGD